MEPLRAQAPRARRSRTRSSSPATVPTSPTSSGALDVFVISSLYEGTPLALFEAMAAGKAIVSTAVDGCREVLEDGETGLLVPPADAESLAQAILRVLGDEPLRRRLGSRAREASRRYDVRTCVDEMQQVYEEVAPRA